MDPKRLAAHVFPTLQISLVSLGTFVDAGHNIVFTPTQVLLETQTARISISGRDPATRLWTIDLDANRTNPALCLPVQCKQT